MSELHDYLGIPYLAGRNDCYSVCRNYLRDTYGLNLPNFARPNHFWEDPHLDLYAMYRSWGFELVTSQQYQLGDVFLMPLRTVVNSHAAVVVPGNQILHHLPDSLSRVDPIYPRWGHRATAVIRHPHVTMKLREQTTRVQLHEVLNADIFRDPRFQEALEGQMDP